MHPVAVAAAKANSLHLNVPVITAAVLGVELNDLIRFAGAAAGVQKQLHLGGLRCGHRKVHAALHQGAAQGPWLADAHRHGWAVPLRVPIQRMA